MRLSRPLYSHRLAPSALRTIIQVTEAGLLYAAFNIVKDLVVGRFLFGDSVDTLRTLRFAAFMVACSLVGGILYAALTALVTRRDRHIGTRERVLLALTTGALLGALASLSYWRRTPTADPFTHPSLTLLAMVV